MSLGLVWRSGELGRVLQMGSTEGEVPAKDKLGVRVEWESWMGEWICVSG